jgi:regulatory protein
MQITAIEKQKRRQRANIYLDGRFAFALSLELVMQAGLRVGDSLGPEQVDSLRRADVRQQAYEAALRLLAYRPRSEREMGQRLARRGLPPRVIGETMDRLRGQGLLDDAAFARFWVESRDQHSPRGRRLLWQELATKGIQRETAREATGAIEEEQAALRAAEKRLYHLQGLDHSTFRRRLCGFLLRRGFSYETVRDTVDRLWQQQEGEQGES